MPESADILRLVGMSARPWDVRYFAVPNARLVPGSMT